MKNYINVETVRAIVHDYLSCQEDEDAIMTEIDAASTSDVAPVRHGVWEKSRDLIVCSVCGFGMFPLTSYKLGAWKQISGCNYENLYKPRFCPHCGAKMGGQGK